MYKYFSSRLTYQWRLMNAGKQWGPTVGCQLVSVSVSEKVITRMRWCGQPATVLTLTSLFRYAFSFLAREVAQVLNNTWSISLKCTPFKVFFGRESRLFQAGSVPVNIVPSDSYLSLMADNGEYQQSDSNCTFYHDEMTSLFHLQESRYKRSMDVRESTEQKYYENYKTYIKKFPITQFKIGDSVTFPNPYSMVWYKFQTAVER